MTPAPEPPPPPDTDATLDGPPDPYATRAPAAGTTDVSCPGSFPASTTLTGSAGETPPSLALSLPGYEILGELGRGGMGVVYRARHLALNRVVALKVISAGAHAGPAELRRFATEAEAIARLQHPHIVQIHELGEHEGVPFLSLEFCPGGSLDRALRGAPLPPRAAAALLEILACAVHHAHEQGVVHRDLKPANVLLAGGTASPAGTVPPHPLAGWVPKVSDFGLAKLAGAAAGQTQSGALVGTPPYMAPEQARGEAHQVGPQTDVYALGAVLYELLTGRPPFHAATTAETLVRVVSEDPAAPRRLQPGTPRDLETACLKCLEKDPRRRYASALELAEDLARFLAGEPIRARRAGPAERAAKWVKRRPALAALVAVSVLAAVLLATGTAAFTLRLARALERAEAGEHEAEQGKENADRQRRRAEEGEARATRALAGSSILLAEAAWREGNVTLARERLDDVPRSLRCWEWRYLRRKYRGELFALHGHAGPVKTVAVGANGDLIASVGLDGTVRVWDGMSGEQRLALEGRSPFTAVALSPDGRRLASGDRAGAVHLWDAATGKELRAWAVSGREIASVALSPDGRLLAAGIKDPGLVFASSGKRRPGEARVWDVVSGRLLHSLTGHRGEVNAVAFSPDGSWLASAGGTELYLWDAQSGGRLGTPEWPPNSLSAAAFSPDGRTVAVAGFGGLRLWDALGKRWFPLGPPDVRLRCVAFSPDGRFLAAAGQDGTVRLWQSAGVALLHWEAAGREALALRGHSGAVNGLAFTPDGRRLVSAGEDATVRVWDARAGAGPLSLPGSPGPTLSVAFGAGGRLASGGWDGTLRLWRAEGGDPLVRRHKAPVRGLAFSPDGKLLASAAGGLGMPGSLRLWDAATGEELRSLAGHACPVNAVAFSPDGRLLASAGGGLLGRVEKGELILWDVATGRRLPALPGHEAAVASLAFARDGSALVSAGQDGTVRLWDLRGDRHRRILEGLSGVIESVALSPDGRSLACSVVGAGLSLATPRYEVGLWDAVSGRQLLSLGPYPDRASSVAFSPDGRRLVAGFGGSQGLFSLPRMSGAVRVWDPDTGRELLTLSENLGPVHAVAFSPDGRRLAAAGGRDPLFALPRGIPPGELRVWAAEDDLEQATLRGLAGLAFRVAFSPDGRRVAAAGLPGRHAHIWDAGSGRELIRLDAGEGWAIDLAFSPDGRHLATAGGEKKVVRLWDCEGGRELFAVHPPAEWTFRLGFSADGSQVVAAGEDRSVAWDVRTGKPVPRPAARLVFPSNRSPDGRLVAWPDGKVVRILRSPDAATLRARRALMRPDPAWHEDEANRRRQAGDHFAEAYHLGRVLLARPWDAGLRLRCGRAWELAGRRDRAAACYLGAVLLDPKARLDLEPALPPPPPLLPPPP